MSESILEQLPAGYASASKVCRLVEFNDVKLKDSPNGAMQMSGYASTAAPDLVNDIIPPSAFSKYIDKYRRNPVYCYNHDHSMPIGKVAQIDITDQGLYLKDITLTPIPVVREMLWPLIKDGVLKQQSIGFLTLDGKWVGDGEYYEHSLVYLLECSIVTVACNPQAMLDQVKMIPGFEHYKSFNDLVRAQHDGRLPLPSEISKAFAIADNPLAVDKPMSTSHSQVVAEVPQDGIPYDADGELKGLPKRAHKNYKALCERLFVLKDGDKFSLPLGEATTAGFKYVWESVAIAMCKTLGARNYVELNGKARGEAVSRIAEAYAKLGKDVPTVEGIPITDLSEEALQTLDFATVEFTTEKAIFETQEVDNMFKNIENLLNGYKKSGYIPKGVYGAVKRFYAYFDVFGSIRTPEDAAMAEQLLEIITASQEPAVEVIQPGAYADAAASTPDTLKAGQELFESLRKLGS